MSGLRTLALTTAVCVSVPGTAFADAPAVIAANLSRAAAAVTSFVIDVQIKGTTGVSGRLTFVRPQSMKGEYTIGPMTIETYLVDGLVYTHAPGSAWQVIGVDAVHAPPQSVDIASSLSNAKVTLLPDRQEDGMTVGVFQIDARPPAAAGPIAQSSAQSPMICSYEKASYRLRVCANSVSTVTYSSYNDPANVVVLPPEAKTATRITATPPSVTPPAPPSVTPQP